MIAANEHEHLREWEAWRELYMTLIEALVYVIETTLSHFFIFKLISFFKIVSRSYSRSCLSSLSFFSSVSVCQISAS